MGTETQGACGNTRHRETKSDRLIVITALLVFNGHTPGINYRFQN